MNTKIELRNKAKYLQPLVRIGKHGLTDAVIHELLRQLKKKQLIKIKFLKSYLTNKNKKDVIHLLIEKTNSELIHSVGNVIILYRKSPSFENNLNKHNYTHT